MLQADSLYIFSDAQLNHSLYVEITPKVERCQHCFDIFLPKVLDILLKVEYSIPKPKRKEAKMLGFTVKQARQYAGFTQREMAEKLGVSRDTYRKIEASPEDATIATAKRISEVVGIPIDQIFFVSLST